MMHSRRDFLHQTAVMAAAGAVLPRDPKRFWASTPAELLPEYNEAMMRELALLGVDEAKRAGANFADIRVHLAHSIAMPSAAYGNGLAALAPQWPFVDNDSRFGIRVIVDGMWGFATESVLTTEAVARAARTAVDAARNNKPRHRQSLEIAPAKAESGEWTMPIEIDPFTIPLIEQREVAREALEVLKAYPKIDDASIGLMWRRFITVFASSEGSLQTQRRYLGTPGGSATAWSNKEDWRTRVSSGIRTFRQGPVGYEGYNVAKMKDGVREAAERAIEFSERLKVATSVDVGRYDLVFSAAMAGGLIESTLARALDLNRALGYHANNEGTSFAAPPTDVVGRLKIAAPSITIRCDRSRPGDSATTAWDEEGVKPEVYTLVDKGIVTDYHTDRQTAPELGAWYKSRGETVRSHGCARQTGGYMPEVFTPNLAMEPAKDSTTVDDLIAGTKKGYYVEDGFGQSDQQLINSQYGTARGAVRKIVNGKLGGFIDDFAFQFITNTFWKSVTAVGGASSLVTKNHVTNSAESSDSSQIFPLSTFRVVPMHVRDVNVLNTGRTA